MSVTCPLHVTLRSTPVRRDIGGVYIPKGIYPLVAPGAVRSLYRSWPLNLWEADAPSASDDAKRNEIVEIDDLTATLTAIEQEEASKWRSL